MITKNIGNLVIVAKFETSTTIKAKSSFIVHKSEFMQLKIMKQHFFRTISLFYIASQVLIGCKKEEVKELMGSPTHIEIDDFYLELEAYIWRDFMPGSGDSKMMSVNRLIDRNQNDISSRFELVKQYVIKKNEIWETDYTSEAYNTNNYVIEKISREGPLWDTGKKVDVICQFRDISTETAHKIMIENQSIYRAE